MQFHRRDLENAVARLDHEDLVRFLGEWRWLVPNGYCPGMLTNFGDWILTSPTEDVYFLDALEGTLDRIAPSETALNQLLLDAENRNRWFMADWVGICHNRGLILKSGQCFGWKLHPVFGGKFKCENIQVFDILVYQCLVGQLLGQLRSKPSQFIVTGVHLQSRQE